MNFKSSLLFAKRILFSKTSRGSIAKKSLAGAVLCIGISLIPLVVILTVSNGMIKGITERLISLSSSHIEAIEMTNNAEVLESAVVAVKNIGGVENAYPIISSSALAVASKKRCGVTLRAVPQNIFEEETVYKKLFFTESGNIADFAKNPKGVLIGKGISERLRLKAGDTIRVVTINSPASTSQGSAKPLGTESPETLEAPNSQLSTLNSQPSTLSITPKLHSYKVCAVVSCGYQELDSLWLFVNFEEGKKILGASQATNSVMIETANAFSPELAPLQRKIQSVLGAAFRVYRWDQLNRAQYENFSSTKILLIFIQLLIVLVACVNISSALIMLVLERRREIAILKSLGAGEAGVSTVFLTVGLGCAVAGLLIGIPLGLLLSVNINEIVQFSEKIVNFVAQGLYFFAKGDIINFKEIHLLDEAYYLKEIPVEVPFDELFFIGLAALLLSLAASVMPAKKAAKQKPLEILRTTR